MAGFAAGSLVTTPRHQVDVIVTEFGAAELRGKTVRERAIEMAKVAHPLFRDDLLEHAHAVVLKAPPRGHRRTPSPSTTSARVQRS